MFFIPCDNWNILILIKVYPYPEFLYNHHVLGFFETSELKEVCITFFISTITVKCQSSKMKLLYTSYLLLFVALHFTLQMKFFLKTPNLSGSMFFQIVLLTEGFTNSLCKVTTNFTKSLHKAIKSKETKITDYFRSAARNFSVQGRFLGMTALW